MNRMLRLASLALGLSLVSLATSAAPPPTAGARPFEGMVVLRSAHDAATTSARLEAEVSRRGQHVFLALDHAAAARTVGLELGPTQLLVFGNPKVGTLLMQCAPSAGLDLPLKTLVWTDAAGATWLAYNDVRWIMKRHGAPSCAPTDMVANALAAIAGAAVAP